MFILNRGKGLQFYWFQIVVDYTKIAYLIMCTSYLDEIAANVCYLTNGKAAQIDPSNPSNLGAT